MGEQVRVWTSVNQSIQRRVEAALWSRWGVFTAAGISEIWELQVAVVVRNHQQRWKWAIFRIFCLLLLVPFLTGDY